MRFNASAFCISLVFGSLSLSLSPACREDGSSNKSQPSASPAASLPPATVSTAASTSTLPIANPTHNAATSPPAKLETATPETMLGTYTLNDPTAVARINQGIANSVKKLLLGKGTAQEALEDANLPPPEQITISYDSKQVTITTNVAGLLRTPIMGKAVEWTWKGEKYRVDTRWANGKLVRTFKGDGRQRINTYSLADQGQTLNMHVNATGGRFGFKIQPLVYELRYKRTSR